VEVFDLRARSDASPGKHAEGPFAYLNRSSRVECEAIRKLIQEWFEHYPELEQAELRTRLRIDKKFHQAWFELFLYSLLSRLEVTVVVHPPLEHTSTTPDFGLVDGNGGIAEYIEATVVTGESETDRGQRTVISRLYDAINQVKNSDFLVTIPRLRLLSGREPSGKLVREHIQAELSRLDPERDHLYSPAEPYRDADIELEFRIIARSREKRGVPGRLLAGYSGGTRWGGALREIRNAVERKAGRYGKLGKPFVIALDVTSVWFDWHEDTCDALYGKGSWQAGAVSDAVSDRGIFRSDAYTRVSAVLVTDAVPWHISGARVCLYHNPHAQHPYNGVLCRLPQVRFDGGRITSVDGLSLADLFGLPRKWPYNDS
jgi:hypothetical protein